jgi:hypothetical protein
VRTEASSAAGRGCLIPVLIDDVKIPLEFTLIQAANLVNWNGEPSHPEFIRVVDAVQQIITKPRPAHVEIKRRTKEVGGRFSTLVITTLVILIAAGILLRIFHGRSPASTPSSVPGSPNTSSSPGDATPGGARGALPEGSFTIKVGDRISDGVPAAGAGVIEKQFGEDTYTFTATRGQHVYFRVLGHDNGMGLIPWQLVDPGGMKVFGTCLDCGEVGVQTLREAGTYILTVGGGNVAATGTYRLQLLNVPEADRFSIKIGQKVAENLGPGAATIESPGAEDIYTFTASPRQKVYFRVLSLSTGMDQIAWQLVDENMMRIFGTCLGCGEVGVQALTKGGTYTLTVGNKSNPSTGTYTLQLFDVPPARQFTIRIGDKIRPGVIESPGAEDIYTFTATPGQKIAFRLLERDAGMVQNSWRLVDENGMNIFNSCLGCGEVGVQTLTKGGTYTLIVGSATNPSTGRYAIEIGQ